MTTTLEKSDPPQQAPRPTKSRITVLDTFAQSLTMGYRGLLKIRHNPEQLFDVVFQPILFTVMFTFIFGGAVSGSVSNYLPLVIPGILVQTIITASIVTGTQLREDMDKGVFDRFRSLPIARVAPLAGALLADLPRYVIALSITYLTGFAIGWRPEPVGLLLASVLVIVCAFALSWIFALLGVLMNKASAVQGVSMLVMFPLTFISNAFVSPASMPSWLEAFVNVNPVSHLVTAVRDLTVNNHAGLPVIWSLVGAVAVIAIFAPLTVRTYIRKE